MKWGAVGAAVSFNGWESLRWTVNGLRTHESEVRRGAVGAVSAALVSTSGAESEALNRNSISSAHSLHRM